LREKRLVTKDDVIAALKKCNDDLLRGINIWDLGLVYDVKIDNGKVRVRMTRTGPTRTATEVIVQEVGEILRKIKGVQEAYVEMFFEPQWTPDRMNDEAKAKLSLVQSRSAETIRKEKEIRFQEYKRTFPAGEEILFERDFTNYFATADAWKYSGLFISERRIVFGYPASFWSPRSSSLEFEDGESFVRVINEMTSVYTGMDTGPTGLIPMMDAIMHRIMFVLTTKRLLVLSLGKGTFSCQGVPFERDEQIADHIGDMFSMYGGPAAKFILTTRKVICLHSKAPGMLQNPETFASSDRVTVSLIPRKGMLSFGRHDLVITRIRNGTAKELKLEIARTELPFAGKVQEMLVKAVGATLSQ